MNTIRPTPHGEEWLQEQLARGPYRSPEEVIERALETLAQTESASLHLGPATAFSLARLGQVRAAASV